jgi:hypothetical protein
VRPLLLTFLLVVTSAAIFLGIAAVGTLELNGRQSAATVVPTTAESDAAVDPADDAVPAAARIRGEPSAKGEPAAAPPLDRFRADRADARPPLPPPAPGPIDLPALSAVTHGRTIRVEPIPGGYAVSGWRDPEAYVEWDLAPAAPAPGRYRVELSFACPPGAGGGFVLAVGDDQLAGQARPTGGPDQYRTTTLGAVRLRPGDTRLTLRPDGRIRGGLMNLRHVRLVPA